VNIYKLKIDETVEDRILAVRTLKRVTLSKKEILTPWQLQEKKRALAEAALSGDKVKGMRLNMNELLALFRPGSHHDDDSDDD
jgi:hypothetical protein